MNIEWVWHSLGTVVSGLILFLVTQSNKRADKKRDEFQETLADNTDLTKRTTWAVESLSKHVDKQNGRIEKLEDRVYRIDGRRIYKKGDDGPE